MVMSRISPTRLRVLGTGSALPGESIDNQELLVSLGQFCSIDKVRLANKYADRLGIKSRHVSRDLHKPRSGARKGMDAPSLCCEALGASDALAGISYLLGHTSTPHTLLPSNIAWVADKLDYEGPYAELRQACTGFASALSMAAGLIAENPAEKVGIVGSENGSPYFEIDNKFADREQLINFVQMGDGAGSIVLTAAGEQESGIISDIFTGQIGSGMQPGISIHGAGSVGPACESGLPYFQHNARQVRKNGGRLIEKGVDTILSQGYSLGDFDWVIPHQANGHIASLMEARFPELQGKVYVTADTLGNLGSAAIWVSFDRLRNSGLLAAGQKVLVLGAEASKYLYGGFVYTH